MKLSTPRWIAPLRWTGVLALTTLTLVACRPATPATAPAAGSSAQDLATTADGATAPAGTSIPTVMADGPALTGDARALGGMAIILDLQWQSVGRQTKALAESIGALCATPSTEHLDEARQNWRLTHRAWMEAQIHEIGPMPRLRLKAQMSWWPANPERIEALIAGASELNAGFIAQQGSTVKGLFALEHLLWAADGNDTALVKGLDAADGSAAARRCRFAAGAAEAMALSWQQADAVWKGPRAPEGAGLGASTGSGAVAGSGASAGSGPTASDPAASATAGSVAAGSPKTDQPQTPLPSMASGGLTPPLQHFAGRQEAINAVVNRMVFVSQELDGMLAKPLGRRTGGTPQPGAAQGTLSGSTVAGVVDGLCGIRALWIGDRSAHCTEPDTAPHDHPFPALGELVRARSPEAADSIGKAIDDAIATVRALPEPFTATLAQDPARIEAAFQAEKALQRALATELVAVLGVNLSFNANDGD